MLLGTGTGGYFICSYYSLQNKNTQRDKYDKRGKERRERKRKSKIKNVTDNQVKLMGSEERISTILEEGEGEGTGPLGAHHRVQICRR